MMVAGHARHGERVVDRYKCLGELRPGWERAAYEYARYNEYLYHDCRGKVCLALVKAC